MKSIKLSLLATAALASLAITMTMQQQSVGAFNDQNQLAGYAHDHTLTGLIMYTGSNTQYCHTIDVPALSSGGHRFSFYR